MLLFAKDFKKHLDAADRLSAALPSLLEEVKASLDLLFRWVVVRICDGNMQVGRARQGRAGQGRAGLHYIR